jgi:hypothetical protein
MDRFYNIKLRNTIHELQLRHALIGTSVDPTPTPAPTVRIANAPSADEVKLHVVYSPSILNFTALPYVGL